MKTLLMSPYFKRLKNILIDVYVYEYIYKYIN